MSKRGCIWRDSELARQRFVLRSDQVGVDPDGIVLSLESTPGTAAEQHIDWIATVQPANDRVVRARSGAQSDSITDDVELSARADRVRFGDRCLRCRYGTVGQTEGCRKTEGYHDAASRFHERRLRRWRGAVKFAGQWRRSPVKSGRVSYHMSHPGTLPPPAWTSWEYHERTRL